MTSKSPLSLSIKLVSQEPFAKLAERKTYWIRIVPNKGAPQPSYAVAAMRCENRGEIHVLSASKPTPGEVARMMRTGFELPAQSALLAYDVIQELLRNGHAVYAEQSCTAVAA